MDQTFEPACRRMEWLDPFYRQVWEKAFAEGIPISGTFELTPRCNFNCKMCYVHLKEQDMPKYGKELSAGEWLRIAEDAKEAGTTWLCITGGEPTMHPEFKTIWKELAQMGFYITLQTNASTITEKLAGLLEEYPPRQAKVTLYGTNNEVYRAVCGVEEGFTRVNDGIHTLMSLGIPVELVSTVIRQNEDDAQNMAFYAYAHQLPWVSMNNVKDSIRYENVSMDPVRVHVDWQKYSRQKMEQLIHKQQYFDRNRKPCTWCRDYRVGYWIRWNGTMCFCSFLDKPDILVRELPFQTAWERLLDYEESLDWPEKCKNCEAFELCEKCAATVQIHSRSSFIGNNYCKVLQSEYREREKEK